MNRTIFLAVALISLFIGCKAQKSQDRAVSSFNRIKISGALNVIYRTSDTLQVMVRAKESELDQIETKIENSTLVISSKGKLSSPVNVYVKSSQLLGLESSGATNFRTQGILRSDSLVINATGAADIRASVETKKLHCSMDGASTMVLDGSVDDLLADLSSASTLKSFNLVAKNANVTTSGAATAKVFVTDRVKATATSASDIKIKGDPKEVSAESSTAASITRIKDLSKNSGKTDSDTTTYNLKKRKVLVIHNDRCENGSGNDSTDASFKHWKGFAMGVNGYMSPGGGVNLPENNKYMDLDYRRSLNFQFNIIEHQINIVKNNFKIVTGLGFDYHLYELANKTTLNPDSSYTWGRIDSTDRFSFKKNKLRCTYIQIPLLVEFNTSNNPDKTFHIAFGVIGQYLLSSRTKQVLEQDKNEITNVRKDGFNLSPFAAKAHVNVGYKGWTFFGEYSLTPLFQSGNGPELYPFTAGVRLIPFS